MGLEGSEGERCQVGQGDPSRALEALGRTLACVLWKWGATEDAEPRSELFDNVSEGQSGGDAGRPGRRLDLSLDAKPDLTQSRKHSIP